MNEMTFHEIHVNARRVLHFIIVATSPDVRLIQAIGFVDPKLEHTWIHLDLDGIVIPSIFNRLAAKVLPIHAVEAVRALEESASGVPSRPELRTRGDEVLTAPGMLQELMAVAARLNGTRSRGANLGIRVDQRARSIEHARDLAVPTSTTIQCCEDGWTLDDPRCKKASLCFFMTLIHTPSLSKCCGRAPRRRYNAQHSTYRLADLADPALSRLT